MIKLLELFLNADPQNADSIVKCIVSHLNFQTSDSALDRRTQKKKETGSEKDHSSVLYERFR